MTAAQYVEYRTLWEQELEKQKKEEDMIGYGFKRMAKLKGPNFPGINPDEVDQILEEIKNNKNSINNTKTEGLNVKISKIQNDMTV